MGTSLRKLEYSVAKCRNKSQRKAAAPAGGAVAMAKSGKAPVTLEINYEVPGDVAARRQRDPSVSCINRVRRDR